MLTRHWTLFTLLCLLLAAGWIALTPVINETSPAQAVVPRPGFSAPDFELLTASGETVRLQQLRGQVVLLNLWASWCPPCKAEMPAIQAVHQAYQQQGLVVLAVNSTFQDDRRSALDFAGQNGLSFPILFDEQGAVTRLYQVRALPTTFFIDRQGVIRYTDVGGPLPEALLRVRLGELLAEAP